MAIDFETFAAYPIKILGINESYDEELTAIADFVTTEIDYTGEAEDLEIILPFFVFFRFCESRQSVVYAETGETKAVQEFTVPTQDAQIRAWNIGAVMLQKLCCENGTMANEVYRSQIGLLA
jgi:hypothetical protein